MKSYREQLFDKYRDIISGKGDKTDLLNITVHEIDFILRNDTEGLSKSLFLMTAQEYQKKFNDLNNKVNSLSEQANRRHNSWLFLGKVKTQLEEKNLFLQNELKTVKSELESQKQNRGPTREDILNQDLLQACSVDDREKAKAALNLGAKLDSKNEAGETPLLVCINNGAKKSLKFILQDQKHYPEVEIEHLLKENDFGGLKFILNYMDKSEKALKLIYSICKKDIENKDIKQLMLDNLLMLAAQFGKIEIAGFAMEHGANVNTHDFKHYTPLHKACENNQLEMVAFLLKRDCDTTIDAHHTNFKKNANYSQLTKQFGNSIPNQKDLHKKAVDLTTNPVIKEMIEKAEEKRRLHKN